MPRESFHGLKRKAAPEIDGVTHAAYSEDLEGNLAELEKRLKEGRYRATPVKRRWIPKSGGKLRPLGIPVLAAGWKTCWRCCAGNCEAIGTTTG
jgi:RNA-directed DNA polymerase